LNLSSEFARRKKIVGENTNTIGINKEASLAASRVVDLGFNAEKPKSRQQNAGQNHTMKIMWPISNV
jgi:hypothetical protein